MCHTAVKQRRAAETRPVPAVFMSHADHLPRVKDDCTRCHTKLPNPLSTVETKPAMSACLSCHEHRVEYDQGQCARCHRDLAAYGVKPVSSYSHAGNFVREHARPARTAPQTCASCHDQTFCTDCHAATVPLPIEVRFPERVDRDLIHRDDYVSRHAIESRADPASCARCHGKSFCDNCHTAEGRTSQSTTPRNPHPIGWALPGSPQFHGPAARRDIAACAACHDQGAQSSCVGCHKVGGIGGDPHPPGFAAVHGRDEIAKNGMCAACHAP
jgi:hypothetical protein